MSFWVSAFLGLFICQPDDGMELLNAFIADLRSRSGQYCEARMEIVRSSAEINYPPENIPAQTSERLPARWVFGPDRMHIRDIIIDADGYLFFEQIQRGKVREQKRYNKDNHPTQIDTHLPDPFTFSVGDLPLAYLFNPPPLLKLLHQVKSLDGLEGNASRYLVQLDGNQKYAFYFESVEGKPRWVRFEYESLPSRSEATFEYGGDNLLGLSSFRSKTYSGENLLNSLEASIVAIEVNRNARPSLFQLLREKGIVEIDHSQMKK